MKRCTSAIGLTATAPALAAFCLALPSFLGAQPSPRITLITKPELWSRTEFRLANIPTVSNPFDPDVIRVDAAFTLPSGRTVSVPGFWYQDYRRSLSGRRQVLKPVGVAEWRVRFTPPEPGEYSVAVTVSTNGSAYSKATRMHFSVSGSAPSGHAGYVRVAPSREYFETTDGKPLPLIGHDVCWPGSRGTYDYDDWFPAMHSAGENFARVWMCPWAFGIEAGKHSLNHYDLSAAWQLDYVMQLAERQGIYILLCLDYHGMFESKPDYWGGNNNWPNNPYNSVNGGPCANQDAFFTSKTAMTIYQKRLRYLIARYGCSPNLLAWELFNEIDNVYSYLNGNDVAAWHERMGAWLHAHDPFQHLVTTSLTGGSDRPTLWRVPGLDFTMYHSYGDRAPATRLSQVAQSFLRRYGKPVMIGEFGTDWRGWKQENDPYLRGLRQGIWGGALGGSVGTAMSWWWQNIHSENLYHFYSALSSILKRTGWGQGSWTNIEFQTSGAPSSAAIGLSGARESLLYVVAADASFPAGATKPHLPLQKSRTLLLANWPSGVFHAAWYDPETGAEVATTQGATTNGVLRLPLPPFKVDLAGIVYRHSTPIGGGGNRSAGKE